MRYIPEPDELIHNARILQGWFSASGNFPISYTVDGKEAKGRLRPSVLTEIMHATGIEKGGRIPAPLVWATHSNRLNGYLIRVGSEEYKQLRVRDEVRANPVVKKRDLVEGGVYMSIDGSKGVYLGSINTIGIGWHYSDSGPGVLLDWSICKNKMLWFETTEQSHWDSLEQVGSFPAWMFETLTNEFPNVWPAINSLRFKGSHVYRALMATVRSDLDETLSMLRKLLFEWLEAAPTAHNICRVGDLLNATRDKPTMHRKVLELINKTSHVIIPPGTKAEQLPEFLAHPDQAVRAEAAGRLKGS